VLREINDIMQPHPTKGDTPARKKIRRLCAEAEVMGKKMSRKLWDYNKKWDAGFWERNPDAAADMRRRLDKRYCVG
jgi:hypothetical protein